MNVTTITADGKRKLTPTAAVLLGVLISVVCPILFFCFYVLTYYQGSIETEELFMVLKGSSLLSKLIFLSMTPNYFMLYVCAKKEWMYLLY